MTAAGTPAGLAPVLKALGLSGMLDTLEAGDPSYRTVKGILAAGTEHDGVQLPLPGVTAPAWLRGPDAFGGEQQ